ncbi:MAG: ceramidase domain-containing protein [Betaproteobacteria bacterium]
MSTRMQRHELWVTLILLAMLAAWLLPAVQQPTEYHNFADRRTLYGVPNAFDVLSNAAFALAGFYGFYRLWRGGRELRPAVRTSLQVFFTGLVLVAFGSGYYHLAPNNLTLVPDRLPMTIAFAGVFGAVVAERVSPRSGYAAMLAMLAIGLTSVMYWKSTDNVLPYAVVQFGGIAGVIALLIAAPRGPEALPWWSLFAWYGLAKVVETFDLAIWQATAEFISGHTLKHIAAGLGGVAVAHALRRPAQQGGTADAMSSGAQMRRG